MTTADIRKKHDNDIAKAKTDAERSAELYCANFIRDFELVSITRVIVTAGTWAIGGYQFTAVFGNGSVDYGYPLNHSIFVAARGDKGWEPLGLSEENRKQLLDFEKFLNWCRDEDLSFEAAL